MYHLGTLENQPIWNHLGSFGINLGPFGSHLALFGNHLGVIFYHFEIIWDHLVFIWDSLKIILGPHPKVKIRMSSFHSTDIKKTSNVKECV